MYSLRSIQISDDALEGGCQRGVWDLSLSYIKKLKKSVGWGGSGAPKKVSSDIWTFPNLFLKKEPASRRWCVCVCVFHIRGLVGFFSLFFQNLKRNKLCARGAILIVKVMLSNRHIVSLNLSGLYFDLQYQNIIVI